jgi:hypothetical protein
MTDALLNIFLPLKIARAVQERVLQRINLTRLPINLRFNFLEAHVLFPTPSVTDRTTLINVIIADATSFIL